MEGIKKNLKHWIQTLSSKVFKKTTKVENEAPPEYYFEKLTPSDSVDIKAYENALDFALSNPDLKNIGITGAFCAGKSSVIETYKKKHPRLRVLTISLAQFDISSVNSRGASKLNNEEPTIEGKIINQLIHQVETKNIPLTSFRVKRPLKKLGSFIFSIALLILAVSLIFLIFNNRITSFLKAISTTGNIAVITEFLLSDIFVFASSSLIVVLTCVFLYLVIENLRTRHFLKKLSIKGSEISVFEECSDSYFDKYLDDVVYLFENCGSDVVIFEDLDRFESSLVFERLREINLLVNRRKKYKRKKTLRFLYLMNDAIFLTKDRTKFFDFIVPIVPILDSSNSYDQILSLFTLNGSLEALDKSFLQDISLYIDDMRVLKNIRNEYEIYKNKVMTTEQNHNKMLAYIVYKNLFPQDFENLQFNRGYLASIFQNRETITSTVIKGLEEQIRECEGSLQQIHKEFLLTLDEIDYLYQHKPEYSTSTNRVKPEFQDEYKNRRTIIEKRNQSHEIQLNTKIREINEKIQGIRNAPFYSLISDQNSSVVFQENNTKIDKEIKSNAYFPLIKYLVHSGKIDENYHDYQTFFYGKSISHNDKIFLRSITDCKPKEWSYKIDNIPLVAERINTAHYANVEVLNFNLLTYIIDHSDNFHVQLDKIIDQLKTTRNESFILDYFSLMGIAEKAIPSLALRWTELPSLIINSSKLSDMNKQFYISMFLISSSKETLEQMNLDNVLTYYVNNNQSFFDMSEVNTEKLFPALKLLNVKMNNVNYVTANKDLWNIMYQNQLFELNIGMIQSIIRSRYLGPQVTENANSYLTLIFSKPEEPLAKLVEQNMSITLKVILENCDLPIEDDEVVLLRILNHTDIESELKTSYVSKLKNRISILKKVTDISLWPFLISCDKVVCNSQNIVTYFMGIGQKYDSFFDKFINEFPTNSTFNTTFKSIEREFGSSRAMEFLFYISKNNQIRDEVFEIIIQGIKVAVDNFTCEGLSNHRVDLLIYHGIITMTTENLSYIRLAYGENLVYFIYYCFDNYYPLVQNSGIPQDELLRVLDDSSLHYYSQIKLITLSVATISIVNKYYPKTIVEYILENNFDIRDLKTVLESYSTYSKKAKEAIEKFLPVQLGRIIASEFPVAFELLSKMIYDSSINIHDKESLVIQSLEILNIKQLLNCLVAIGHSEYVDLFGGKHPLLERTSFNEKLLQKLKQIGWVTTINEETDNYYRVYARKLLT